MNTTTLTPTIEATAQSIADLLTAERDFFPRRLAEVCPEHQQCMECGGPLCEACHVGGSLSRCPHGDPICAGCDPTERCGDCWVAAREDAAAARGRFIPCPVCQGVGAIQHGSRNPELIRDCTRCDSTGEVRV